MVTMWFLMFFIALVSVFFVDKNSGHFDAYNRYVNDWLPTALPKILWFNTAVLLLSSVSAELARQSMFREDDVMDEWIGLGRPITRRATAWLSVTLALGLAFLAGQWMAWRHLAAQHVYIGSNPSSKFFYIITWAHASHLALGVLALRQVCNHPNSVRLIPCLKIAASLVGLRRHCPFRKLR